MKDGIIERNASIRIFQIIPLITLIMLQGINGVNDPLKITTMAFTGSHTIFNLVVMFSLLWLKVNY